MAWAEPEEAHADPGGNVGDADSGCPTAEEEARLYLEQEEYYANIDESPFSLGEDNIDDGNDADEFWSEIPAAALGTRLAEADEQAVNTPSLPQTDNELARELFGVELDAARVSRRKATTNAQGQRFWENLEDCSAPTGRGTSDLQCRTVEELFEDSDEALPDTSTAPPPSKRSKQGSSEPTPETSAEPGPRAVLSEPMRASIKRSKAEATDQKRRKTQTPPAAVEGASSSGPPTQAEEQQARGRKRPALTDAQRLRIANNKQAAEDKKRRLASPRTGPPKPTWNITSATSKLFGTADSTSDVDLGLTSSQKARVACSLAAANSGTEAAKHLLEEAANTTPISESGASAAATTAPATAEARTPVETAPVTAEDPAPTGENRTHKASEPDDPELELRTAEATEEQESATVMVTKDPVENLGLRRGLPASRRHSQGAHNQVDSLQNRKGEQEGARALSCSPERKLPHPSAGGSVRRASYQLERESNDKRRRDTNASCNPASENLTDTHSGRTDAPTESAESAAESKPPSCRPAGPKWVASAPGVFAPGPTQSAQGVPRDVFSGLVGADATLISPEEHANGEDWDNGDSVDTSEAAELSIEPDWETSFASFLIAQRNLKTEVENRTADNRDTAETSNEFESSLSTEDLTVLLELAEDGLPVNWPQGLDARVAKIILTSRAVQRQGRGRDAQHPDRAHAS